VRKEKNGKELDITKEKDLVRLAAGGEKKKGRVLYLAPNNLKRRGKAPTSGPL